MLKAWLALLAYDIYVGACHGSSSGSMGFVLFQGTFRHGASMPFIIHGRAGFFETGPYNVTVGIYSSPMDGLGTSGYTCHFN